MYIYIYIYVCVYIYVSLSIYNICIYMLLLFNVRLVTQSCEKPCFSQPLSSLSQLLSFHGRPGTSSLPRLTLRSSALLTWCRV